ncbi:MAG: hypothetical protein ACTSX6_06480 [Candidatus Heimdallarchaeaceae archaeon]
MKAIALQAVFLLVVIGLIIGATLIVFWKWLGAQSEPNEMTCKLKLRSYCSQVVGGKNPDWSSFEPKGCEPFIGYSDTSPPSEDECKELYPELIG